MYSSGLAPRNALAQKLAYWSSRHYNRVHQKATNFKANTRYNFSKILLDVIFMYLVNSEAHFLNLDIKKEVFPNSIF
jgi:hypothetical protein